MQQQDDAALLNLEHPAPAGFVNPGGASPFLLIGDHAGRAIPPALGTLGIAAADMDRHIAWDIGVRGMGEALAERLDAVFVHQLYSRLVIDCNRDPAAHDAIPARSDGTDIPGNTHIDAAARAARVAAIHTPYQQAIADEIARRAAIGQATVLVSLHSFTPVMNGYVRPWQVGILHFRPPLVFAHALMAVLRARGDLVVGDNEPYRMDGIDYTVPRHAFPVAMPYAEIEVRQDLIGDADGQARWAEMLGVALREALRAVA